MEILNDDELKRLFRSKRLSDLEKNSQRERMRKCDHFFVKIKETDKFYAQNSTDFEDSCCEIECVKCGMTNRFKKYEELFRQNSIDALYPESCVEEECFEEWEKKYNEKQRHLKFISDEAINFVYPTILYRLSLKALGDLFDLNVTFSKMKEINQLIKQKGKNLENSDDFKLKLSMRQSRH